MNVGNTFVGKNVLLTCCAEIGNYITEAPVAVDVQSWSHFNTDMGTYEIRRAVV